MFFLLYISNYNNKEVKYKNKNKKIEKYKNKNIKNKKEIKNIN